MVKGVIMNHIHDKDAQIGSLKIIFVCLQLSNGGAERVLSVLANTLADKGYDVEFVILFQSSNDYILSDNIRVIRLNWNNSSKYCELNRRIRELRNVLDQRNTVVISFLFHAIAWVTVSTAFLKVKRIYSERNDPRKDPNTWFKRQLRNICYVFADRIVFQTKDQMALYPQAIRKKGIIIGNPITNELPDYKIEQSKKIIISVCRYEKQKNVKMSIDAFEDFYCGHEDFEFHIYGRGILEEKLEAYIESKNMSHCIKLKGFSKDLFEKMKYAMAFISSSNYEGMSNAILEAMAIGIPVICTDCPIGGNRMLIKNGENGFLVKVGDSKDLSEKLSLLIDDRKLSKKVSDESKQVRKQYNSDEIAMLWLDMIKEMT